MDVVVGSGPLARTLARILGNQGGNTVLAGEEGAEGPFLWRRANPVSGESLLPAMTGAKRVFVILERPTPVHGVCAVIDRLQIERGVSVVPYGIGPIAALAKIPTWSHVDIGPCWGLEEPLIQTWSDIIAVGAHLWRFDPGPVFPVAMPVAVETILAAVDHPGARWRLPGHKTSLPYLASELGLFHRHYLRASDVAPRIALWRLGLHRQHLRGWTVAPPAEGCTDAWLPTAPSGPAGWFADLRSGGGRR